MKRLKVHDKKRYLMWDDGTPFFYMADTAWELLHRLRREEMLRYLDKRREQEFNVIQVVLLAEKDGLRTPNARGHLPLAAAGDSFDPAAPVLYPPEDNYWTDLDWLLQETGKRGMMLGILPTWGDKWNRKWGEGPEIFNEENAWRYGKWLGSRYRDVWNIIWVLGGDRPVESQAQEKILDRMAEGLKEGDGGNHLITFHPSGAAVSTNWMCGKDYIDFHAAQSGHGTECYRSPEMLEEMHRKEEKPCLDMESRYEDFPVCFQEEKGCWRSYEVRNSFYWNIFSGACGQTYGHRAVWCFAGPGEEGKEGWEEALFREGAEQLRWLKKLRLSRPYFDFEPASFLDDFAGKGCARQVCARGEKYIYAYSPLGLPLKIHTAQTRGVLFRASWYNPRNGEETCFATVDESSEIFVPPSRGAGEDWVLILDILQ